MNDNSATRIYGIIITLLLLLSAGIGWFFWNKSKNMMVENQKKQVQIDSLVSVKTRLQTELDSLQLSYANLRTENETLAGRIAVTAQMMAEKDAVIQRVKTESVDNQRDLASLRAQVQSLQQFKTEYETVIQTLKAENEQLRNENLALKGDISNLKGANDQLTAQVTDLSEKLAEQIRKTQSAVFKATSFKVEVERRNDKITSKARRAREILISFDLANVPATYQGPQKLYLSITDEKGKPIPTDNPTKTTVMAPSGTIEIVAQAVKPVTLDETSRQNFAYKLEDKLKSGNYVVAIYCDKGLLGASSFRLN